MQKVIIDTDPGVDDAMAIAFACADPDIELLGLTTVFGNVSVKLATRNALTILEQFGVPEVPVAEGEATPLVQEPLPHPDFVHGEDGLGNIGLPPSSKPAEDSDAADFIIEQANRFPGEVTLVAVGPLTNVAVAISRDPALPEKLKALVVMGGTLDEPGNVSPVAEANFLGDPHAADQVFELDWPATIVGLDVTHQIMLFDSDLQHIQETSARYGDLLWRSSRFYVAHYTATGAAKGLAEPGCAMHDAAALAYVINPGWFETADGPARVVEEGIARGQLTMNRKGLGYMLPHWENRPVSRACVNVDVAAVKKRFLASLAA